MKYDYEPKPKRIPFWFFIKKTWYAYLIVIPFVVFGFYEMELWSGWIAFLILALSKDKDKEN